MIAREGFDAHGMDLSPEASRLGKQILAGWGVSAQLKIGNFLDLPYSDRSFHAVVDVFSSYVLNLTEFDRYLAEVARVLKPQGRFFLFTPSAGSDAFRNHAPATKIDEYTLNGIHRKDSPYAGNLYPFRFSDAGGVEDSLRKAGLQPEQVELTARTSSTSSALNTWFLRRALAADSRLSRPLSVLQMFIQRRGEGLGTGCERVQEELPVVKLFTTPEWNRLPTKAALKKRDL